MKPHCIRPAHPFMHCMHTCIAHIHCSHSNTTRCRITLHTVHACMHHITLHHATPQHCTPHLMLPSNTKLNGITCAHCIQALHPMQTYMRLQKYIKYKHRVHTHAHAYINACTRDIHTVHDVHACMHACVTLNTYMQSMTYIHCVALVHAHASRKYIQCMHVFACMYTRTHYTQTHMRGTHAPRQPTCIRTLHAVHACMTYMHVCMRAYITYISYVHTVHASMCKRTRTHLHRTASHETT